MLSEYYEKLLILITTMELSILISIFIFFGVKKLIYNYLNIYKKYRHDKLVSALNNFLIHDTPINFIIYPSDRNTIKEVAKDIQGDYFLKLKKLYRDQAFGFMDKKNLYFGNRKERYEAIERAYHLQMKYKEDVYIDLIKNKDLHFTSLVLKQYIYHYKKRSFVLFSRYLEEKKNLSKGMLYSLVKNYSLVDSDGIVFLISRTNNVVLLEALLNSAYLRPSLNLKETIFKCVFINSPLDVKCLALKCLAHYPDKESLRLMKELRKSNQWQVRLYVCKLLYAYRYKKIKETLKLFINDENYYVRREAVKVLITMNDKARKPISFLENELEHPSHQLLINYLEEQRTQNIVNVA